MQKDIPSDLSYQTNTAIREEQLPGFWSLLVLIFKNTLKLFFKKLPSTLLFMSLALALHTYLLVVKNEGFGPSSYIGNFLSLTTSPWTGIVIWTVVPMLISGLWGKLRGKSTGPGIAARVKVIQNYYKEAKRDAIAVLMGGVGLSLSVGAVINGYASLTAALGLGAFLASKSGSVVAMLFRSAWTSLFGIVRRKNSYQYGMAAGYITIAASSLGFIANSVLTPNGTMIGMILMIAAVAMALGLKFPDSVNPIVIFLLFSVIISIFGMDILFADDGGWVEGGGNFGSWWRSSGAVKAILMGVGPAIGAGVGPLIQRVLSDIADQFPDVDGPTGEPSSEESEEEPTEEQPREESSEEGLIDPETGKPLIVQDGSYEGGKKGQVWWEGKWVDPEKASDAIRKAVTVKQGLVDPDTGEPLIVQDGSYEGGKKGQVWWEGKWVDKSEALRNISERRGEIDRINRENEQRLDAWRKRNKELDDQRHLREAQEREQRARQKAEDDRQREIIDKVGDRHDADVTLDDYKKILELKSKKDYEGVKEIYKKYIEHDMDVSQKEHDRQIVIADRYEAAETVAKTVLIASKTAMVVVGGPAGMLATGAGVGAISAAEEGAESQARGDSTADIIKHTAGGFVSGFKDGAIGHYVNAPGVSTPVKILLPAAADSAEVFVRTGGDVKETLKAAAASAVAGAAGHMTGNIKGTVMREVTDAGATAAISGAQSMANGGTFAEGAKEGLYNHVAGKIGGAVGGHAASKAEGATGTHATKPEAPEKSMDHEESVTKALHDNKVESGKTIPIDEQPDVIKKLHESRRTVVDADGKTKTYVDPAEALDQLKDTKASRSAKRAPEDVKEPIIDTRKDLIYKPADDATIKAVKQSTDPDTQKWIKKNMKEGDKLVMDTFSTPGKKPGLGADRDARLVVEHKVVDPETGRPVIDPKTGKQKVEHLEVPRKHWEDQAYKDFYENAKKINGDAGQDFEKKLQNDKDFQERYEKLEHLKGSGLSEDQIKHRAYAESRNQLFTDKAHVEASLANSDQAIKNGKQTQVRSNILDAKEGKAALKDPEGYARMWKEKSHFYHDHPAEALAQSKKGIAEMMELRQGQRSAGLDPAPLKPEFAEAMKIIIKSPTDASATPEALAKVNEQIKAITDSQGRPVFKDAQDAMSKIGGSVEFNKWTPPARSNTLSSDLSKSQAMRTAINEQEREMLRELQDTSTGGKQS